MGSTGTLTSDITIDVSKFHPSSISDEAKGVNGAITKMQAAGPGLWDVGPASYREMWGKGQLPLPAPVLMPEAKTSSIPSRDAGRDIPIRVFTPENGQSSKGIFLHFHGGGWTIGSETYSDVLLKTYAHEHQLTSISVGYRLGPEDPWPAGRNDCFDVAEYLVDNGEKLFGAPLVIVTGESAGGHYTCLTALHLLRVRPEHQLKAIVMRFGIYDLSLGFPSVYLARNTPLIDLDAMQKFVGAVAPSYSIEELRKPDLSPMFEDLQGLAAASKTKKLPPALFICGSLDPMLDDSLLMGMKWMMTGSEAIVKIYPGGAHGFTSFPVKEATQAAEAFKLFVTEKLT